MGCKLFILFMFVCDIGSICCVHIRLRHCVHENCCICGKCFEPRGISYLFGVIFRVRVVFRKTVVGN